MAQSHHQWTKTLSTVMLGLRTCFRSEIDCSPAEMLYGTNLILPGEFFNQKPNEMPNESEFIQQLRQFMNKLGTSPGSNHRKPPVFVQKELKSCTEVFVRKDRVKAPLEQPYSGPFKVIEKSDKYFKIEINGKQETVSIDRLKAAHRISEESQKAGTPKQTRSGRHIRFVIPPNN
jgi:cleavage and polyadenylation specificity factor subunit 1